MGVLASKLLNKYIWKKKSPGAPPPLPKRLLKNFHCEPQHGRKKYGNDWLDGWYIPTSGDSKIFWVSKIVDAKYLSPGRVANSLDA